MERAAASPNGATGGPHATPQRAHAPGAPGTPQTLSPEILGMLALLEEKLSPRFARFDATNNRLLKILTNQERDLSALKNLIRPARAKKGHVRSANSIVLSGVRPPASHAPCGMSAMSYAHHNAMTHTTRRPILAIAGCLRGGLHSQGLRRTPHVGPFARQAALAPRGRDDL
jgi:hypothetical protein